jgi:hypothetical protein
MKYIKLFERQKNLKLDLLLKRGFNGVYKNGGEIKMEKDEIVIDTLERDMESYNL